MRITLVYPRMLGVADRKHLGGGSDRAGDGRSANVRFMISNVEASVMIFDRARGRCGECTIRGRGRDLRSDDMQMNVRGKMYTRDYARHQSKSTTPSIIYTRLIMPQTSRLKTPKRKTSRWNAFLSQEMERRNACKYHGCFFLIRHQLTRNSSSRRHGS